MLIRFPKDNKYFSWTRHIKNKMIFYGLSESRIKRVLEFKERKEEGIAPNTVAVMKRNDRGKKKEEIWVMYCRLRRPQIYAERTQTNAETKQQKSGKLLRYSASGPRASATQPERLRMISAWRYPGESKPGKQIPIPDDILKELKNLI